MQHRPWNPKSFFRKLTPEVTSLYESAIGVALERDPERPRNDQTFFAWQMLPERRRLALEAKLLLVNDLSASHGRPYLDLLATTVWLGADAPLVEASREWTTIDLAMRLFLADEEKFTRCHQNYAVDMMDHLREYRGTRRVTVDITQEKKALMQQAMAAHFRESSGGGRCNVEEIEGDGKIALFIYGQDEMTPEDELDEAGNVIPVWRRPIVRIAAIFYTDTCTLLVKAPRKPDQEKLRTLFATIFVEDEHYFEDVSRTPKWKFGILAREDFVFPTHPADRIVEVSVVRVTLESPHSDVKRVSIDLKPGLSMTGVHIALRQHSIDLASDTVIGVRFRFRFVGKGRERDRPVSLFNPNSTNLRDTVQHRIIRRYLREWGFDDTQSAFALAAAAA